MNVRSQTIEKDNKNNKKLISSSSFDIYPFSALYQTIT